MGCQGSQSHTAGRCVGHTEALFFHANAVYRCVILCNSGMIKQKVSSFLKFLQAVREDRIERGKYFIFPLCIKQPWIPK